ncbi:hypothetical protein [Natrialba sp. SSL1]|nr:hypothetical protein [Natrialba sp. SSL1]
MESPPVVRVLGGWKSVDAMFECLVLPDDFLFSWPVTFGPVA